MRLLALAIFGAAAGLMVGGFLATVQLGLQSAPSWEPALLAGFAALVVYTSRDVIAD